MTNLEFAYTQNLFKSESCRKTPSGYAHVSLLFRVVAVVVF